MRALVVPLCALSVLAGALVPRAGHAEPEAPMSVQAGPVTPILAHPPAAAKPAGPDVAVAFSKDRRSVALQTSWIEDGSGFPDARIELFDVATGARTGDWTARLVGPEAMSGTAAAVRAARADAADTLSAAAIDLDHPASPRACADGVCGATHVTVASRPTVMRRGDCAGRGTPELLTLKVNKATWVRQTTPAEGCPSGWALRDVYEDGRATLVVLAYHVPGFEGSNVAIAAFAGRR